MPNKELADKWLAFASDDLKIISDVIKVGVHHLACFHAQQSAEKSLKGFIVFHKGVLQKTHSLIELLNEAVSIDNKLENFRQVCLILDRYYIPTRYPDALPGSLPEGLPNKERAEESFRYAQEIFDFITIRIE